MMLGIASSLMGCDPAIDDGVGLEALRPTIKSLGVEVVRIGDDALTTAYRNHAATWQAAKGE